MKAIMYGGGNIGRGFIGALFSRSGYEVTFIDVAEKVVNTLHEKHCYPVRIVSASTASIPSSSKIYPTLSIFTSRLLKSK